MTKKNPIKNRDVAGRSQARRGGTLDKAKESPGPAFRQAPELDLKSSVVPPQSARFLVRIGPLKDLEEAPRVHSKMKKRAHPIDRGEPRPARPATRNPRAGSLSQEDGD